MHAGENKPAVEVVLTVLHAGGKFGGGGYKVSGGLHGVGVSVVNALSKRLEVEIRRDGCAVHPAVRLRRADRAARQGRRPTDRDRHHSHLLGRRRDLRDHRLRFETLSRRMQEMAFLNKGLAISLRDERADHVDEDGEPRSVVYHYQGGIVDFVKHLNATKGEAHRSIISFEAEDTEARLSLEVAMQWNTGYTESVHTFANTINTHEGGTHEEGFRAALTSLVNKFCREWGMLKEKDDQPHRRRHPRGSHRDRLGQAGRAAVRGPDQDQARQHRGQGVRPEGLQRPARRLVRAEPRRGQGDRPQGGRRRARAHRRPQGARPRPRPQGPARVRRPARQARRLPVDRARSSCELYIVEGDSAGGSAKGGRDPRIQAILPIRGKILNVEKARIDRVLANTEVQALISALGTGIHDEFDVDKLRYHKIILMADADVDGQHIRTLLLTLLFRFMRPLIEVGYVYLAQPPLYKLQVDGKEPVSTPTPTASATG